MLKFIDTQPSWSPAPVCEADIGSTKDQRNYVQIWQPYGYAKVNGELIKVAREGRFIVSRIADPGGQRSLEGFPHVFTNVDDAKQAANEWYERYWQPLIAEAKARNERIQRQFNQSKGR